MKKSILIILLLALTGCTSSLQEGTINSGNVLTDLRANTTVVRNTNGDWINQVGNSSNLGISGQTKDGYDFETQAYIANPSEGYTFVNKDSGRWTNGISIRGDIEGSAIALCGSLKGIDESKYIWITEAGSTSFADTCSLTVMVCGKIAGKKVNYEKRNISFYDNITKNNNSYDFRFEFDGDMSDIYYVSIDFSIVTVEYPSPLDAYTLTNLYLEKA